MSDAETTGRGLAWSAELCFLHELRDLCGQMEELQVAFHALRSDWLAADAVAAEEVAKHPREFSREAFDTSTRASVRLQAELWGCIEAFLTAWARASLIVNPRPRRKNRELAVGRGDHLRSVLRVDKEDLIAQRGLRDAWMHFDERLDSALAEHGSIIRQKFVRTLPVPLESNVIRVVALASQELVLAGESYSLEDHFDAVRDLQGSVQRRLGNLPSP